MSGVPVRTFATATLVAILLLAVPALAEEDRCKQLGANCVCSEPFDTATLVQGTGGGMYWYNPGDSTSKQCATEPSVPGGAIERGGGGPIVARNDAAALAALPSGKTIARFMGGTDGHIGIFFAGHTHNSATYTKRLAARFYIYHTPNFQFAQEGVCTNAKLMQFTGPNSLLDHSFGPVHMYNFTDWSPAQDCCFTGPGPDQSKIDKPYWRGKWVRVEAIYTNRSGPGWRMQVYMKNVTDNGPELLVVDTGASGTQLNQADRTPPKRQDKMAVNLYRETGCQGWEGISHYMMAGWDTDAGQRIGAATEVEGGGGTPPPPPPVNWPPTAPGVPTVTGGA